MEKLSRTLHILFLITCTIFTMPAIADNGNWTIYTSYHSPQKAVKIGKSYYVLASGNLCAYNTEDSSVETFDKTNALSDFGIYDIAYSKSTNSLFILYTNGNIDIMRIGKQCINLPDLKNKSIDKNFNEVNITGEKAYISTSTGIVVVNIKKSNFENFYNLRINVTKTRVSNTKIYATTSNGVYVGNIADNLLDTSNWTLVSLTDIQKDTEYSSLKNENIADAEGLALAKENIINSPVRNYSYKLNMIGERLLVTGGQFYFIEGHPDYVGTVMKYENNIWTNFDEQSVLKVIDSWSYNNVTDVIQDPKDSEHHWVGVARSGLYEFKDYKLVKLHSLGNSPLKSSRPFDKDSARYVRITGLQYDNEGNIWMLNNQTDTIVRIMKNNGKWLAYYYNEIAGFPSFDNIMFDSRGWAWINSRRTTTSGHIAGLLIVNTNGTIDTQDDDTHKFISTISNQDGTSYTPNLYYCATEALDGSIWIGTESGLFVSYNPENVFDSNFTLSQIKVARQDGSGLADYLLSGVPVKCIAIDGGNRKWIGTIDDGVFLISSDGLETIEHFTTENSPLISNAINDIAINGQTGEIFIATRAGLCSFVSDATDASDNMDDNSLKVYPNPIRPGYTGDVHVTGLMFNSNVKIVNAAGKLVYEGTSIGGEFTWNCCYKNGKQCSSGIYFVLGTDEEGKKGACTKIMIIR